MSICLDIFLANNANYVKKSITVGLNSVNNNTFIAEQIRIYDICPFDHTIVKRPPLTLHNNNFSYTSCFALVTRGLNIGLAIPTEMLIRPPLTSK